MFRVCEFFLCMSFPNEQNW